MGFWGFGNVATFWVYALNVATFWVYILKMKLQLKYNNTI